MHSLPRNLCWAITRTRDLRSNRTDIESGNTTVAADESTAMDDTAVNWCWTALWPSSSRYCYFHHPSTMMNQQSYSSKMRKSPFAAKGNGKNKQKTIETFCHGWDADDPDEIVDTYVSAQRSGSNFSRIEFTIDRRHWLIIVGLLLFALIMRILLLLLLLLV